MATPTVSSIARVSPRAKDFYRATVTLSASTVKYCKFASVQIKFGKQKKISFFSTKCPRSNHTGKRLDDDRMPPQIHPPRSKIANKDIRKKHA